MHLSQFSNISICRIWRYHHHVVAALESSGARLSTFTLLGCQIHILTVLMTLSRVVVELWIYRENTHKKKTTFVFIWLEVIFSLNLLWAILKIHYHKKKSCRLICVSIIWWYLKVLCIFAYECLLQTQKESVGFPNHLL